MNRKEKELPKMYQTKINKTIPSIQKVYSTINNENRSITSENKPKYSSISIERKINQIFNALDTVYKADVTIVTDTEKIKRRIIARNQHNIITIDNEYIPISLIRDIYK